MKIVSVIPLKRGILKGDLTYFTGLNLDPGNIVSVPLKNKNVLALVTSVEELKDAKSNIKNANYGLKRITENKGESIFLTEFLASVFDTSKYFVQNKNDCLMSLIPNIFIENYERISNIKKLKQENKNFFDNEKKLRSEKLLFQYRIEDRISIYKTLIRESFARSKSVIIILPTQFDIEKFNDLLSKGIEQFTFILHSGIIPKKNLATFEKIMTSTHPVLILCTPPFLSIPKKQIGTIILEHENSSAYKTIKRPHFDLRTFVEIYASKINAKLIMADDILRFETIGKRDMDGINPLHPLSFRTDFGGDIEIIVKKTNTNKKFQILEDQCIDEIRDALEHKKNVFIFSLRKGLATMTVCRDCGEMVSCKKCGAPLVLYLSHKGKQRMFVCNKCEAETDGDAACTSCGGWNLMPLGIGTDTVYEEAKKLFPNINIIKLDKESVKSGLGAKKIINEFEKNKGSILVGTEMAFFYFKKEVQLSVIASFDSLWSIPNFKMSEKIIQLIFSMIENTSEKIIVQTRNEGDETLCAVKSGNLSSFVREELEHRQMLNYPPFKRFIKITYFGDKIQTNKARELLASVFAEFSPEIFSGFVAKFKGKYVTNCLIKIDPARWSLSELKENSTLDENLFIKLSTLPSSFEVIVDPDDLL